jgi:hypothetical protein
VAFFSERILDASFPSPLDAPVMIMVLLLWSGMFWVLQLDFDIVDFLFDSFFILC